MADKEDAEGGGASANPQPEAMSEDDRSPDGVEDNVTLSFLDKLKCMMYSKVERDAFLIEKLEKEEKKKAKKAVASPSEESDKGHGEEKKKKKKVTIFDKLKSVFSTPEEEHEFLKRQVQEVEEKKRSQSAEEGATQVSSDAVANPQ